MPRPWCTPQRESLRVALSGLACNSPINRVAHVLEELRRLCLPTNITWELPEGVSAGEIAWPLPKKFPIGNLANYGYEGTVLLAVPLTVGPSFKPSPSGTLNLKFKASWLVCKKECIPEDGEFTLQVPTASATATHARLFKAALDLTPQVLPPGRISVDGSALRLELSGLPASLRGKQLEVFPETGEVIETAGAWTQGWRGDLWTAILPLSPQRGQSLL